MNNELKKDFPEEENNKAEELLEMLSKFKTGTPERVIFYASIGAAIKEHLPEEEAKKSIATIHDIYRTYPIDVIFTAVKMLKNDLEKDPPARLTKTAYRKMTRTEIAFLSDFLHPLGISTRMSKKERT